MELIIQLCNMLTFETGGHDVPHDVPSAALFTQAAKASIRSLQPPAPFSATLEERLTTVRPQVNPRTGVKHQLDANPRNSVGKTHACLVC